MSETSTVTLAQRNYCDRYEKNPSTIQKQKIFAITLAVITASGVIIAIALIIALPPLNGRSNTPFFPFPMVGSLALIGLGLAAVHLHSKKEINERTYIDLKQGMNAKLTLKTGTIKQIKDKFLNPRGSYRNDTLGMAVRSGYLTVDQANSLEQWSASYKEAKRLLKLKKQQFPNCTQVLENSEFSTESLKIKLGETEEQTLKTAHAEYQKNKLIIEGIDTPLKELQSTLPY